MRRRALLSGNGGNIDYSEQYLTFRSITDCTHKFTNQLEYSTDNGRSWSTLAANTGLTVAAGKCVMWKAKLTPNGSSGIGTFSATGKFNAEGNPMSLLFGDNFKGQTSISGKNYALCALFKDNSNIIGAENMPLPATTLASSCYYSMFQSCTSLTSAPILPATTLASDCYRYMFKGCTNLTDAPELPATTLAADCYHSMFAGCTGLTTAPVLPAKTLAGSCYYNMFESCTSLTTSPILPAKTLIYRCYCQMFRGCTRLNSITCLATDISANSCTTNWVSGVASSGTFTKASSMKSWTTGVSGIPSGWTTR